MDDVLAFWMADPKRWWAKDPAFDDEIRARFGTLHDEILRGEHEDWLASPRGALAYVIALDQFSRNMFRGTSASACGSTCRSCTARTAPTRTAASR